MPKRGFKQGECCEFVMSWVLVKFWRKKPWISKTDSLPFQKRTVASNLWSMWGHQIFNERNFQTSWQLVLNCWMFWPCRCLEANICTLHLPIWSLGDIKNWSHREELMQQRYHGDSYLGNHLMLQPRVDLTKGLCGDTKGRTLWMVLWLQRPLLDQWGRPSGERVGKPPSCCWCWGSGHGMSRYVRNFGGFSRSIMYGYLWKEYERLLRLLNFIEVSRKRNRCCAVIVSFLRGFY